MGPEPEHGIATGDKADMPALQHQLLLILASDGKHKVPGGFVGNDVVVLGDDVQEGFFDRGDIDVRRFTPHDTRSTAKGHMRNMGIPNDITEIALNHALKGMEAVYDVREEIPERRQALEKWAAFIEACETGRPWNVQPIRRVA